ncbi:MarR family winged helix-turn-helix transcriptional regulator [Actinomadura rudentiformis]|uniref:Winged helix-turn-helix transcriptional regulator n=1 Tax=Actinomadura rudentiformis TaxID=359158 RepID=A0A6H9YLQ5_9ACTN|nr:MarR family winged helix-turn-helix transcriptional regulator [Actinomadura rudentiformis]KAB2339351.1 winged helix-turn-helix transcriptional regulator [Actinomadura rudentiformis]
MSSPDAPGFELPLRLLLGFRVIIDELHAELARRGHPDLKPMYGFACQAIGPGVTAVELGRKMGVSKQAAGKTIDQLTKLGYVERATDPHDARRKIVRLTPRGIESLTLAAEIFDQIRARWVKTLGADRVRAMEQDLRTMTPPDPFQLDMPRWFGTF